MICPACGHLNLPGADWCNWCQFALMVLDRPVPQDRVERSLMADPVTVLGLHPPTTLTDDADLGSAVAEMIDGHLGAVLVIDATGKLVGILTERDFLTKVAGQPGYAKLPVCQFMTRHPETVSPKDTLAFALGKMAGGNYRHLPVVEGGKPIGTVSVKDILRHVVGLCADV
jgi:CBS domain-containing protein